MKKLILCVMILMCVSAGGSAEARWESPFNGKDLTGWRTMDGPAPFYVEDGVIAGEAVDGPANTFLCTEKKFGNFVMKKT